MVLGWPCAPCVVCVCPCQRYPRHSRLAVSLLLLLLDPPPLSPSSLRDVSCLQLALPGYTGFRRRNQDTDLVAPIVGTTDEDRHRKFARAASAVLSSVDGLAATSTSFTSELGSTFTSADYKVPPKNAMAASRSLKPTSEKKFVATTMYANTYPDYVGEVSGRVTEGAVSPCGDSLRGFLLLCL